MLSNACTRTTVLKMSSTSLENLLVEYDASQSITVIKIIYLQTKCTYCKTFWWCLTHLTISLKIFALLKFHSSSNIFACLSLRKFSVTLWNILRQSVICAQACRTKKAVAVSTAIIGMILKNPAGTWRMCQMWNWRMFSWKIPAAYGSWLLTRTVSLASTMKLENSGATKRLTSAMKTLELYPYVR